MRKLLVATKNPDKFQEIKHLLKDVDIKLLSLIDFHEMEGAEEDGLTLLENSQKKAEEAFRATGIPSVADDTGLVVEALQGMPGVFSARFAGPDATYVDNRRKLLKLLHGVNDRRAKFVTVVTYVRAENEIFHFIGEVEGFITVEERGNQGFGYDSIFLYPPMGITFAEMSMELKNKLSHRSRAFREFKKFLINEGRIS